VVGVDVLNRNFRSTRNRSGAPAGLWGLVGLAVGLRCVCAGSSGWLPVGGYFGYLAGGGLAGDVDPAGMAVTGDADLHERVEGVLVDAVVSVADMAR